MSEQARNSNDRLAELYDLMLMEYASGVLDDTLSLLVASHLTLSPAGRRSFALYESLGGALIGECCEPVAMMEHSLHAVLGQLDGCGDEPCAELEDLLCDMGIYLPQPLQRHMKAHACNTRRWHRARGGVRVMPIPLAQCPRRAHLVHAGAGAAIPRPRHSEREYTLVIQGSLRSQHDYYEPGDLFVIEGDAAPRPVVDSDSGVCLVIVEGGNSRRNWFRRLLKQFSY